MRSLLAGALFAFTVWGATSPIADVAMKGDMDAVRSLVKQHPNDVNVTQPDGGTALLWAAYWNDDAAVEALIAAGANVNAANRYGVTPLSQACINGNAQMVEALLKAGADANTFQHEGQTALMTAAKAGNADAVKALLDHGAEVNAKESMARTNGFDVGCRRKSSRRGAGAGGPWRRCQRRLISLRL